MTRPDTNPSGPNQIDWPRFVQLVGAKRNILLTTHHRPDCDAVGSQLGMYHVLRQLGKQVATANPFDLPPNLRFLDPEGILRHFEQAPAETLASIDLLLVLDTSAWAQLGGMG
ncbi:MAG: bifunctional oligoribonuclease/PAP phosphatase NrnA, partial [Planctomycetota bacterium]|nr:bifunctional oligoribonuclease/PAP phosphatase NrnA [Planctomycetota bacterium]